MARDNTQMEGAIEQDLKARSNNLALARVMNVAVLHEDADGTRDVQADVCYRETDNSSTGQLLTQHFKLVATSAGGPVYLFTVSDSDASSN